MTSGAVHRGLVVLEMAIDWDWFRTLRYRKRVFRALRYRKRVFRALRHRKRVFRALRYRKRVFRALRYRKRVFRALRHQGPRQSKHCGIASSIQDAAALRAAF